MWTTREEKSIYCAASEVKVWSKFSGGNSCCCFTPQNIPKVTQVLSWWRPKEKGKLSQSCCSLAKNVSFSEITQLDQPWQALPCPYHAVKRLHYPSSPIPWDVSFGLWKQFQCTSRGTKESSAPPSFPMEDQKQHIGFRGKAEIWNALGTDLHHVKTAPGWF